MKHWMNLATSSQADRQEGSTGAGRSPRIYKPELDALRFFAFLGIFLYHKLGLTHFSNSRALAVLTGFRMSLDYCVSLFFFLSSYLITSLLEIELQQTKTVRIKEFYARRILRIWPLYYFFLTVCIAFGLAYSKYRLSLGATLTYLFFAGNWFIASQGWEVVRPTYGLLWSVCVEEQFYAICPLLVRLFRKRGLIFLSIFSLLGSYVLLAWLGLHGRADDHVHRTNFFVQVQFFAAGTLMALIHRGRSISASPPIRLFLLLAGLLAWFVAGYWFDSRSLVYLNQAWSLPLGYLLNLCGCAAIFTSFLDVEPRFVPPLTISLGKISYGLYVYHLIIITVMTNLWHLPTHKLSRLLPEVAAQALIALGLTIVIAKLSYRFLEKPFLLLKDRFTLIKSRPV